MSPAVLRTLAGIALPAVVGGGVLLLTGTWAWPPWAAVLAVAATSGVLAFRRKDAVADSSPEPARPVGDAGRPTYHMQRALRAVAAQGVPADTAYRVSVSTRTHLAVVVGPNEAVGPQAHRVPGTGHNLILTITAPPSERVTMRALSAVVVARTRFPRPVGMTMATPRMPDLVLSADLLESLQRSVADYRPLAEPDIAILLDAERPELVPLRPAVPGPESAFAPGTTTELVFAPVTAVRGWVRWRLSCEITCGGRTDMVHWDLSVTAETGMSTFHPDGREPEMIPVHQLYGDHWDPANNRPTPSAGDAVRSSVLAQHVSADGGGVLLFPTRPGPVPEPAEVVRLWEAGDAHLASGAVDRAIDSYRQAAAMGSARAAYSLGSLFQRQGDLAQARQWLLTATRGRIFASFNDLGAVLYALGDVEEAETWFRRAMDEGDWKAAINLARVHRMRGELAAAEEILRLAQRIRVPEAAGTLAGLLMEQGRLDEVEQLLVGDAAETEDIGPFQREARDMRLLRLTEFLLYVRGDVSRALDTMETAIETPDMSPAAVTAAASALDDVVDLLTRDRSGPADAVRRATTLRARVTPLPDRPGSPHGPR